MRIIYLWLTFVAAIFPVCSNAQMLEYQKIIEVPETSPSTIIDRANKWAVSYYTSYQDVMQYKDTTTLSLTGALKTVFAGGKGMSAYSVEHLYRYNLLIEAKKGRMRVSITNFRMIGSLGPIVTKTRQGTITDIQTQAVKDKIKVDYVAAYNREFDQIEQGMELLFSKLESAVKNDSKDDW